MKNRTRGFTLIELLVVIAIIGLLSSIVLASLGNAKNRANVSARIASAKQIQSALELYYLKNSGYPSTSGNWYSDSCTTYKQPDWIPGLVSGGYIASLPKDPNYPGNTADTCCYMYRSDGKDYKLLVAFQCDDTYDGGKLNQSTYLGFPSLIDPRRDGANKTGGYNSCGQETNGVVWSWAIYTPNACSW